MERQTKIKILRAQMAKRLFDKVTLMPSPDLEDAQSSVVIAAGVWIKSIDAATNLIPDNYDGCLFDELDIDLLSRSR